MRKVFIGASTLIVAAAATAWPGPDFLEDSVGEAGSLPGTAPLVNGGFGSVGSVRGNLGGPVSPAAIDFEDMYVIWITEPADFRAATVIPEEPGVAFDTQLWLFSTCEGYGLLGNDDAPPGTPGSFPFSSQLLNTNDDGALPPVTIEPGLYYLAVSGFDNDPESTTGAIFNQMNADEISGPDGPGGAGEITLWSGGGDFGAYTIEFDGVSFLPPCIVCPPDVTVPVGAPTDPGATGFAFSDPVCEPAGDPIVLQDFAEKTGNPCQPETIHRIWGVFNECGFLIETCEQLILIVDEGDGPTADPPPNRVAECHSIPDAPLTIPGTDDCDGPIDFDFIGENTTPGSCKHEYTLTRFWSATNSIGETTTVSQLVFVQDNTPPMLTGAPANVTVACPEDVPDPLSVQATDNCSKGAQLVLATSDRDNGGTGCVKDPLVITRSYTATDACGNVAMTTQTIVVVDDEPPTLLDLPGAVTIECGDATPDLVSATDNCSVSLTVSDQSVAGTCPDDAIVTRTWTATDRCGNTTIASQTITVLDTTPPTPNACPSDILTNAEAGGCDAVVTWPAVSGTDNCDPEPAVTYDIDLDDDGSADQRGLIEPMATLPAGTHRITAVITDRCGNVDTSCTFLVDVSAFNELFVNIELVGEVASPLTRCLRFEVFDCGSGDSATIDQLVTFTDGVVVGELVLVPCGAWTCLTLVDDLHTLRRTDEDDFGILGTTYAAGFRDNRGGGGDDDRLIGGNLNQDPFIDVLDFGIFVGMFEDVVGASDCTTADPHADISGNGTVDAPDFTFIAIGFLEADDLGCCSEAAMFAAPDIEPAPAPVLSISVAELVARGLGDLAAGDVNGDGILDLADIADFASGLGAEDD